MSTEMATTWRDLADQLSPEQIAKMEASERIWATMPDGPVTAHQQGLVSLARELAGQNAAAVVYAHIPRPAGAEDVGPWEPWDDDDIWSRAWFGHRRPVPCASARDDIGVYVAGIQHGDGRNRQHITLESSRDEELTAAEARELAAVLLETADELDALNVGDKLGEAPQ